ncbi:MAG TPA: hypothetical protein VKT29_12960 [Terriglobales bacterium]|nr:hypothetical protein [Terriglobales bacterium]
MHGHDLPYSEVGREYRKAFICDVLSANHGEQFRTADVHPNTMQRFISARLGDGAAGDISPCARRTPTPATQDETPANRFLLTWMGRISGGVYAP